MVDLDGVLNTYDGNYNEKIIPSVREGAKEFLRNLHKEYDIEIFTVRNKKLTVEWLMKNELSDFIKDVVDVKNPNASVIIDDRALRFEGDFDSTYQSIINFQPHWKN